jgi:predicted N-formylglutamate amidohydrolase
MTNGTPYRLLADDEPAPITVHNARGRSPFLIVVDHAGNAVPRRLGGLGIPEAELLRHIGWDIGVAAVSRIVADALDAILVQQNYSRLVIDCNRTPGSPTSIPEVSELTSIPANVGLSEAEKSLREQEIFRPYHDRIEAELDQRERSERPPALVAMHSFTPVFMGVARPWQAGVLYNRDPRFARVLMALLQREEGLIVGDNEPYSVSDTTDYTIPAHGERRGVLHVEVEIRQDLIADEEGRRVWGALLTRLLPQAYQEVAKGAAAVAD